VIKELNILNFFLNLTSDIGHKTACSYAYTCKHDCSYEIKQLLYVGLQLRIELVVFLDKIIT
jgi:hypothetical protein